MGVDAANVCGMSLANRTVAITQIVSRVQRTNQIPRAFPVLDAGWDEMLAATEKRLH